MALNVILCLQYQFACINTDRTTYANELRSIEPALSKFILGHKGLPLPQQCPNFRLREPSIFSSCDEQIDHMAVKIRAN